VSSISSVSSSTSSTRPIDRLVSVSSIWLNARRRGRVVPGLARPRADATCQCSLRRGGGCGDSLSIRNRIRTIGLDGWIEWNGMERSLRDESKTGRRDAGKEGGKKQKEGRTK